MGFNSGFKGLKYTGYRVFPGVNARGRGADHPPRSIANVKNE